jgi:predicted CXXCH cytochrome family protein
MDADPGTATYVGPAACIKCHGSTTGLPNPEEPSATLIGRSLPPSSEALVKAFAGSAHSASLIDARISPQRIVAQFGDTSPLKRSQIAFAIGIGRSEQRYCDASLRLLPHRWDARARKWAAEPVVDAAGECLGCHATGFDATTREWSSPGVTCEACHGPGSLHARDGDTTRIVNPRNLPLERQAMICGQCHSDGRDPAKVHPFPVGFRPGENLDNSFVQTAQPRPGPKYSELLRSKHARMNVICTDCHNPHGPVPGTAHQLLKPVNELCTECHVELNMAQHAPKAAADATCATCHMPGGSHQFKTPARK